MNPCEGMDEFIAAASAMTAPADLRSPDGRDASTGFDVLWAQLGRVVRTYPYTAHVTPTSFGRVTLRDVLAALPPGSVCTDASNFWSTTIWPHVKLTTHKYLGGEPGFLRVAAAVTTSCPMTFVAFEGESLEPAMYTCGTCVCYVVPEIISAHAVVAWMNMRFLAGPAAVGAAAAAAVPGTVPSPTATEPDAVDIQKIIIRWKTERPGQKPTIPKLAEFTGADAERLKKAITKTGKSWTQILADNGFRAST